MGKAKAAYRVVKGLLIGKLFGKRVPINVMWRITNRCNAKCSYCYIRKQKKKELTTSQIFKIIDELDSLGCARIGFVGGEAFIREDFGAIVDYVKSKGIYVTLVSNGILVPSNMDIVRKLDCLVLSFDGRKESHEKGRKGGSFDGLMKAFEVCRDEGINVLTITVLNKYNLGDIDYVIDTVKMHGFYCNFHLLQGGRDYLPTNTEYRKSIKHIIRMKNSGAPIISSIRTLNMLLKWRDYGHCISDKGRCYAGEYIFNIDTDGSMAACDLMAYIKKKHPNALENGIIKGIHKVEKNCGSCTCVPVMEYNQLFSLGVGSINGWARLIIR